MYASIARRRRPSIASRGRLLLIDGLGLVCDQGGYPLTVPTTLLQASEISLSVWFFVKHLWLGTSRLGCIGTHFGEGGSATSPM
jgi:hypothetical protein